LVQKDLENGVILTQLESTDNKMPRALEDIIDILVKKGTKVSDVPEAVIKVYKLKKDLRGKILK
jgi:hypothetical protein